MCFTLSNKTPLSAKHTDEKCNTEGFLSDHLITDVTFAHGALELPVFHLYKNLFRHSVYSGVSGFTPRVAAMQHAFQMLGQSVCFREVPLKKKGNKYSTAEIVCRI